MKKLILATSLFFALSGLAVAADAPKAETTKVCLDVKDKNGKPVVDPKTGKTKQSCKVVKKHKKHEGTKIEDAKKK